MLRISFRSRDGLARECSLRFGDAELRTPALLPDALLQRLPDARVLGRGAPPAGTAALADVPTLRLSAHTPPEVARRLVDEDLALLRAADGPSSAGHLHLSVHRELVARQLEALYEAGVPAAWVHNLDDLEGEGLVEALAATKDALPDVVLAAATRRPALVPFLVMCGVDLFDPSPIGMFAARGLLLHDLQPLAVEAPALGESLASTARALELLRAAVRAGTLREAVEAYCARDVEAMRSLRLWDAAPTARFADAAKSAPQRFVLAESMGRAEVAWWERALRERYIPPQVSVLLLLPCSHAKPYSSSRTHRAIREAVGQQARVHEVVVTSPLGAVPRELEAVYPAAHYDIPVTGRWSAEEVCRSASLVQSVLAKGSYERVVGYLPGGYGLVADELARRGVAVERAQDLAGLAALLPPARDEERRAWGREAARAVLDVQFGPGMWGALEPFHLRKGVLKAADGRGVLARLDEGTGLFALSAAGGEALAGHPGHRVEVGGFEFADSIFAPGVEAAPPSLRRGEEVVVVQGGRAAAVGRAEMAGPEMVRSRRGLAVSVRERVVRP